MAKGKYYAPEFKERAVKMVVGLDCTWRCCRPMTTAPCPALS